jgi:hypothetical protein
MELRVVASWLLSLPCAAAIAAPRAVVLPELPSQSNPCNRAPGERGGHASLCKFRAVGALVAWGLRGGVQSGVWLVKWGVLAGSETPHRAQTATCVLSPKQNKSCMTAARQVTLALDAKNDHGHCRRDRLMRALDSAMRHKSSEGGVRQERGLGGPAMQRDVFSGHASALEHGRVAARRGPHGTVGEAVGNDRAKGLVPRRATSVRRCMGNGVCLTAASGFLDVARHRPTRTSGCPGPSIRTSATMRASRGVRAAHCPKATYTTRRRPSKNASSSGVSWGQRERAGGASRRLRGPVGAGQGLAPGWASGACLLQPSALNGASPPGPCPPPKALLSK